MNTVRTSAKYKRYQQEDTEQKNTLTDLKKFREVQLQTNEAEKKNQRSESQNNGTHQNRTAESKKNFKKVKI